MSSMLLLPLRSGFADASPLEVDARFHESRCCWDSRSILLSRAESVVPANVGPEVDFVWKAVAFGGDGIDCLPERGYLPAEPCGVPQDKSVRTRMSLIYRGRGTARSQADEGRQTDCLTLRKQYEMRHARR